MKTLIKASMLVTGIGLLMACTSENAQQQGDIQRGGENIVATFTGQHSDAMGKTRTIATHTKGDVAHVSWIPIDRIWVKATNGVFYQSGPADTRTPSLEGPRAYFSLTAGEYGFNPVVHYTGASTSYDRVNILSQQSGGAGSFAQLSNYGDCGSATAVGGGGDYEFTLNHKASYLCLYPRFENVATNPNVRLTKITIFSTGAPLAGTFDFADGKIKDKPALANGSTTITAVLSNDHLPIATSDANSYYFVLRPSSTPQTLTVVYTVKDPTTNVSVDVSKTITETFDEGKIYDYTAWLDKGIRDDSKTTFYYMWDAKQHFWWNHLNASGIPDGNFPQNETTDPQRYYNTVPGYKDVTGSAPAVSATNSAANCPNVNEMIWYAKDGDPHWENTELVMVHGHLYKGGGVWLKKKEKISGYSTTHAPDGIDYTRSTIRAYFRYENSVTHGRPGNTNDYFFLPALGDYYGVRLEGFGQFCAYWSSTPSFDSDAYYLFFDGNDASLVYNTRFCGYPLFTAQ